MNGEEPSDPFCCPYCGERLFRSAARGERLKASIGVLVIHKSGNVEVNCKGCKHGVLVPLVLAEGPFALKKSEPKFVVGLTATETPRQE